MAAVEEAVSTVAGVATDNSAAPGASASKLLLASEVEGRDTALRSS
jgi:hypothetical protein